MKYREKMLLWTDDEENSAEQRSVVAVIAHELAHMVSLLVYPHFSNGNVCLYRIHIPFSLYSGLATYSLATFGVNCG